MCSNRMPVEAVKARFSGRECLQSCSDLGFISCDTARILLLIGLDSPHTLCDTACVVRVRHNQPRGNRGELQDFTPHRGGRARPGGGHHGFHIHSAGGPHRSLLSYVYVKDC